MGWRFRGTNPSVVVHSFRKMLEALSCGVNSSVVPKAQHRAIFREAAKRGGRVAQWQMPTGDNPVRTAVRFPMKLAIRLQTEQGEMEAMTENISANGLLFVGEELPPLEAKIEFTIAMPSAVMGTEKDVTIHCIGRVVRHYLQGGQKKAAAVIDEYFLKA
jgi:hypothetical protein